MNESKKAMRDRLDRALKLRSESKDEAAVKELLSLLEDFEGHPGVTQVLGETYFLMDRHGDALPHALAAVKLRPKAVNGSLTLFHCLLKLGRKEDAYREMLRFMSLLQSDQYDSLAEGLAGNSAFEQVKREVSGEESE